MFAQVSVQVADEGIHELPLVIFDLGVNFCDQEPTRYLVPLNPAGVLDVLPAPLPHPSERRVRATQVTLRALEDGFQWGVASRLRNNLQDSHVCALFLVA